jgi:hypothetical protein
MRCDGLRCNDRPTGSGIQKLLGRGYTCRHTSTQQSGIISMLLFFSLLSLFQKIRGGLLDHLGVCVCVCVRACMCMHVCEP